MLKQQLQHIKKELGIVKEDKDDLVEKFKKRLEVYFDILKIRLIYLVI